MTRDSRMAKDATRRKSASIRLQGNEEAKQDILARNLEESKHAFMTWETSQNRIDQQLYHAIGRLAEFAAAVGNDHEALMELGKKRGVRITKASNVYMVIAKLVVTNDRRKASKYGTVLQFATRRGAAPTADDVAEFIKAEGGIEACLRAFRGLPRGVEHARRRGRPSAFGRAVERIAQLQRTKAPDDLHLPTEVGDYVLIMGVRDVDGSFQLIRKPIEDEKMIRKAITVITSKEES
jgi:hypothetical protein